MKKLILQVVFLFILKIGVYGQYECPDKLPNPLTDVYGVTGATAPCGSTANILVTVTTYDPGTSWTTIANGPVGPGSWALPSGWSFVSLKSYKRYILFNTRLIDYEVYLKPDPLTSGTATVRNATKCNQNDQNSWIYSDSFEFTITRGTIATPTFAPGQEISMCVNSPKSFSVNPVSGASSYTWEVSGAGLQVVSSATGSQISVTSATAGEGSIRVKANGSCPGVSSDWSAYHHVTVNNGPPVFSGLHVSGKWPQYTSNGDMGSVCGNESLSFTPYPYHSPGQATEYQWEYYVNQQLVSTSTGTVMHVTTPPYSHQMWHVRVRARNGCDGWGPFSQVYYHSLNCDGGEDPWFISPNPASDFFEVNYTGETQEGEIAETYELKLFNSQQKEVLHRKTKERKVTVDTKKLNKGVYYLHIITKKGVTVKKVIIEK